MPEFMTKLICFNGSFIPEGEWMMGTSNRGFRYGDGVFETIRMQSGQLFFVDDHFERLVGGMYTLGLDTTFLNPIQLCSEMLELCSRLNYEQARVRINIFRNEGGNYRPTTDLCSYLITADPLENSIYTINEKGLRLGLYSEIRKPVNSLSGIKSSNALLYVLAARYARDNGWDDAVLLNEYGRICEATASNIFLVLPDKRILTPPIAEGILPGVMRKNLIRWMRENGYQVEEAILLTDDFYRADEVFLSNSIQGIRWVIGFRERRYFSSFSRSLVDALNTRVSV
jgi:branched-chain amino acid aminotransferase